MSIKIDGKNIAKSIITDTDLSDVLANYATSEALNAKADVSTTYTKTETDTLLDAKVDTSDTTVTKQGNTFNGSSQLLQLGSDGKMPTVDGSSLTNVKSALQLGTCSTASATTEKAVTLSGFALVSGATIQVTFSNANTASVPTLNVNSTGAKAIYSEDGIITSATNPAYFPAGSTVEFTYNGTDWVFKNRIVTSYVNGTSWYKIWSDGWIEQGGTFENLNTQTSTITLLKSYTNTNYNVQITPRVAYPAYAGFKYDGNTTISSFEVYTSTTYVGGYWAARGY